MLTGLPASTLAPFQRVLHAVARILFWISSCVTVWLRLSKSCTGYQLQRGSSTNCQFTSRFLDTCQSTSWTYGQQSPICLHSLHCMPHRVATSSYHGRVDRAFSVAAPCAWNRLPTNLKLLWLTGSFCRKLKAFLFVSVYRYQGTDWLVLWCALGLPVGGTILIPWLLLLLSCFYDICIVYLTCWYKNILA